MIGMGFDCPPKCPLVLPSLQVFTVSNPFYFKGFIASQRVLFFSQVRTLQRAPPYSIRVYEDKGEAMPPKMPPSGKALFSKVFSLSPA
jgi:hypothetical protein